MREKTRYLLLKVEGQELHAVDAKHCLHEAVFAFLGEHGAAQASVFLKQFNEGKQEAIVKCSNKFLEQTIAALSLKRFFRGKGIALRLVKVSGTIAGLE